MTEHLHYEFEATVDMALVADTMIDAELAIEAIHGRAAIKNGEADFTVNLKERNVKVYAGPLMREAARVFTRLLMHRIGETEFAVAHFGRDGIVRAEDERNTGVPKG
jgi:hypothetical protein